MKLDSSDEYILRISAGPSYANLKLVAVNYEEHPMYINNDYFTGWIAVRVRNFDGVTLDMESSISGANLDGAKHQPLSQPVSGYFNGRNRLYS
jgi:hypothetical protein